MCLWSETISLGKWHDRIDGSGRWIQVVVEAERMEDYWNRMASSLGQGDPPHPKPRRIKYFHLRDSTETSKAIAELKRGPWTVTACVNVKACYPLKQSSLSPLQYTRLSNARFGSD